MKLDGLQADRALPAGLLTTAHETWKISATHVRISHLHRDVSRVLSMLGHQHFIEHLTEDKLFSMDISLAGELSASAGSIHATVTML